MSGTHTKELLVFALLLNFYPVILDFKLGSSRDFKAVS